MLGYRYSIAITTLDYVGNICVTAITVGILIDSGTISVAGLTDSGTVVLRAALVNIYITIRCSRLINICSVVITCLINNLYILIIPDVIINGDRIA